jgi:hypothetical protein
VTADPPGKGPAPEPGDESVPLQFVDLLYAVPVADLAVRVSATHLDHVSASGWTDLALQLSVITFGWIGHHTNRRRLPPALQDDRIKGNQFLTLRFPQLVVEILIIVAYFALGTKSYLPAGAGIGHPSVAWKGLWLTVTFGLYGAWDLLDLWIVSRVSRRPLVDSTGLDDWRTRDRRRLSVTATFTGLIGVLLWGLWASSYHHGKPPYRSVVGFDLAAIGVLYVYRIVQERVAEHGWGALVRRV